MGFQGEDSRGMSTAMILIDHGSREKAANQLLEHMAELVRTRTEHKVYVAHMELAEPTLAQAYAQAVAEGAGLILVFPYFLAPGRHSRRDIPRLCAEAAALFPQTQWHCMGPLGLDPCLADLIVRRALQCQSNRLHCDDCPDQSICQKPD